MKFYRTIGSVVSIAIGTVLGVSSLALTSYDPLWNWLDVPGELRASLPTGFSIFFIIVGFLFGFHQHQMRVSTELCNDLANLSHEMRRSIPNLTLFTLFTSEEAYGKIANILPSARVVLNTRIFQGDYNPDTPNHRRWNNEIVSAVQHGLNYREVVSSGNTELVYQRRDATVTGDGQYCASILDYPLPSFANFAVFHLNDTSKEVWFGWLISRGSGFEGRVVRTMEPNVVDFFEQWHRDLFAYGYSLPWRGPTT
ncbi:MAG: hypothetical protein LC776_15680 [Acidobacteria bacterium]|nr:hypothetical protein [Acidobacteriota bacterium]